MARGGGIHQTALQTSRSSYTPSPEDVDYFMFGQCAAWAVAHSEKHPDLGIGFVYFPMSEEDSIQEAEEDGEEWDGEPLLELEHVFTHDEEFVYDARGKQTRQEFLATNHQADIVFDLSQQEVLSSGMVELGVVSQARELVAKHDPA